MLWAAEELFTVWLQLPISSELAAGRSSRAPLEPGMGHWSRGRLALIWHQMQWLHCCSCWLQRQGQVPFSSAVLCLCIPSHEALLVHHTRTARAIPAAGISSQKTQKESQAYRNKNWISGHANVHSHCWKQFCSFRSVRAVTDVSVSVLSLFEQWQSS